MRTMRKVSYASERSVVTLIFAALVIGSLLSGPNAGTPQVLGASDLATRRDTTSEIASAAALPVTLPANNTTDTPRVWPTSGTITSEFGAYESIRSSWGIGRHKGIDIASSKGTPVMAFQSGTVSEVSSSYGGCGRTVIVDHGGNMQSLYCHLSRATVSVGQVVQAGEEVGKMGSTGISTGNHLHFQINVNGSAVNPGSIVSQP